MAATGGHYLQPEESNSRPSTKLQPVEAKNSFYDTINEIRMIVPLTNDHRGSSQNGFTNAVTHYWQYYLDQPLYIRIVIAQTWRYFVEILF